MTKKKKKASTLFLVFALIFTLGLTPSITAYAASDAAIFAQQQGERINEYLDMQEVERETLKNMVTTEVTQTFDLREGGTTESKSLWTKIKDVYSAVTSPIDTMVNAIGAAIEYWTYGAVNAFCAWVVNPWGPSYNTYLRLEAGNTLTGWDNTAEFTADEVYTSTIITMIHTFAMRFGIALASIMVFFFLAMCLLGRAEQIRDTPFGIFAKYVVALVLIRCSWGIAYTMMSTVNNIWTQFIVSGDKEVLNWMHFYQLHSVTDKGTGIRIFNILFLYNSNATMRLFMSLFWIFFVWKLIKQMIKLILEVAERYFVFTMMLLFFPAIAPSIISNSTSAIMGSYIRMFVSQAFLLLADGVFLKIFVLILIRGGWTYDITGYICAFAYVRFCQRIDSYMASMGLNVAQTGGGIMEACGGALMGLSNAMRTFSGFDRGRRNLGEAIMQKGAETQNAQLFEAGAKLNQTVGQKLARTELPQMPIKPEEIMSFDGRRAGEVHTVAPGSGVDGVFDAGHRAGMTDTQIAGALKEMTAKGISPTDIKSISQVDGTNGYSGVTGSKFSFNGADGKAMATTDVSNKSQMTYTTRPSMPTSGQQLNSSAEMSRMFGVDASTTDIRKKAGDFGEGVEHYKVGTGADSKEYEVSMVGNNPDALTQKGAHLEQADDGTWFSVREVSETLPDNDGRHAGAVFEVGDDGDVYEVGAQAGIHYSELDSVPEDIRERIGSYEQLDGTIQDSSEAGHRWMLRDEDGEELGVFDTSHHAANFYADVYGDSADSVDYVADSDIQRVFGPDATDAIRKNGDFGEGVQRYTVAGTNGDSASEYEVKYVPRVPEALDARQGTRMGFNKDGAALTVRKITPKAQNGDKKDSPK